MKHWTIEDVRTNWRCLDSEDFSAPDRIRLISHIKFKARKGFEVEYIAAGKLASLFRFSSILSNFFYALRLLRCAKADTVLLLYGGGELWLFVGLANKLPFFRRRSILIWGIFVEVEGGWRRRILTAAISTCGLIVLWSREQVEPHATWLGLPKERFIFIPYKANHSQGASYDLPIGNYVFAGGNGKRDYKTLVDAFRGTGIPVVISATDPAVRNQIERLPNVIAVAAWEPSFAQLQAGSRFTIVPMVDTGLKGGGEANMLNGMWHGKPVIAVDRMAANHYIVEGETGYIVPPGDSDLLRRRVLELWNDPEKCREMGRKAKIHVDEHFTHEAFIKRLLRLGKLCFQLQPSESPRA